MFTTVRGIKMSTIEEKIINIIREYPQTDQQFLAEKTNLSTRTVRSKLKDLIQQGKIKKKIDLTDMRRSTYQLGKEK